MSKTMNIKIFDEPVVKLRLWISFPESIANIVLVLTSHFSMGTISIYEKTNVVKHFSRNLTMD